MCQSKTVNISQNNIRVPYIDGNMAWKHRCVTYVFHDILSFALRDLYFKERNLILLHAIFISHYDGLAPVTRHRKSFQPV